MIIRLDYYVRTILGIFLIGFILFFGGVFMILFGGHGCGSPDSGSFDVILKDEYRTSLFPNYESIDQTRIGIGENALFDGTMNPVSFAYFWSDRGSVYRVSKDIYLSRSLGAIRIEVEPSFGCTDDGGYEFKERDIELIFDGRKHRLHDLIKLSYWDQVGVYRLDMSLNKQFKNEWNLTIHWMEQDEFDRMKNYLQKKKDGETVYKN